MQISVLVSCDTEHHNSGFAYIECFAQQTLPHHQFEIIVLDNVGRDAFRCGVALAHERFPSLTIRYQTVPRPGRAAAFNEGLALARAPFIVLIADDALPTPTALAAHLAYHQRNSDPLAVSIGPTVFTETLRADPLRRWLEDSGTLFGACLRQQFTVWDRRFFFSGNSCLKRTLFDKIGVFNEAFPWVTWDDYEFGLRLGAAGGYSQLVVGALAWHEHYVGFAERVAAMRKGGHAAYIHGQLGAHAEPWLTIVAANARNRESVLPVDNAKLALTQRAPIFKAHFDRAFAEGFEAEARGDRSDIAALTGAR
ncbi:MAG: glycosyltransferase [Casimicrobium sp.]